MSKKYITAIHLWWYKCLTRKGWVWHHPQDNTDPTDRLSHRSQVWGFLFTTDSPCNSQVSHNYRCLAGNRQPNNSAINLDSHITHGKPFPDTCVYPASVSDEIQHNSLWGSNSSMGLDLLTIINMHLLRQQLPKNSCRNYKTTENVRVWCRNTPCTLEQCPRWVSFDWFGQEPLPNTPQKTL